MENEKICGLLILLIVIYYISKSFNNINKQNILGDLTGAFYHKKTSNGNTLKVEYYDKTNDKFLFRKATKNDKIKLKKLKIIK